MTFQGKEVRGFKGSKDVVLHAVCLPVSPQCEPGVDWNRKYAQDHGPCPTPHCGYKSEAEASLLEVHRDLHLTGPPPPLLIHHDCLRAEAPAGPDRRCTPHGRNRGRAMALVGGAKDEQ